jgi:hypothetical protein
MALRPKALSRMAPRIKVFCSMTLIQNSFNEECHVAKGKQTCSCFLGSTEICQLFYFAARNVTIVSIQSRF